MASSPSLLWETSKAYARGLIISYIVSKKCKIAEQQKVLETRLTIAAKEYIRKPTGSKLKEIAAIHCTLNSLLTQTATDKLRFAKQKLFEHGDKPGKYLAYLTKKRLASHTIASVIDGRGTRTANPEVISNAFSDFYSKLYQSEQGKDAQTIMENFFSKLDLPNLATDERSALNAPISKHEVQEAIKSLQSGKAPDPDGLFNFIKNSEIC